MSRDLRGALTIVALLIGAPLVSVARAEEPATTVSSDLYDRYTADPAESYVVETSDAQTEDATVSSYEPQSVARAPGCRAFYPAVVGSAERSAAGTLCEQSDGSLRMVAAPWGNLRVDERPSGYCREYQQMMDDDGEERAAHGTVCWQTDGSWRVVRPATFAIGDAPRDISEPSYAARAPYPDEAYETFAPAPRVTRPAIVHEYHAPEPYFETRRREEPLRSARLYPAPSYAPRYRNVERAPSFGERIHRLFDWRRSYTRPRDQYRRYDRRDDD